MVHKFSRNGTNIVVDVYSGMVHVVSDVVYDMLDYINESNKDLTDEIKSNLSAKYSKEDIEEAYEEISFLIEKMAGHLLFNFLSRPDFISYGYETDKNFSFRVMRAVFHPVLAAWTVRSKKDSEALQDTYDVQIFEAFHP